MPYISSRTGKWISGDGTVVADEVGEAVTGKEHEEFPVY